MMVEKKVLETNIDKVWISDEVKERVSKNLGIDYVDELEYCKKKIIDPNSEISKFGLNYYCRNGNIVITINASTYRIVTAHIVD